MTLDVLKNVIKRSVMSLIGGLVSCEVQILRVVDTTGLRRVNIGPLIVRV